MRFEWQIAPTRVRGSLGSINQLVICIGIVAALVVNVVLPATSWRTMFYLAALPGLLLALGAQHACTLSVATPPTGQPQWQKVQEFCHELHLTRMGSLVVPRGGCAYPGCMVL